jgi:hypothetical protein
VSAGTGSAKITYGEMDPGKAVLEYIHAQDKPVVCVTMHCLM